MRRRDTQRIVVRKSRERPGAHIIRDPSHTDDRPGRPAAVETPVLVAFAALFGLVAAITGIHQDYWDYDLEWRGILAGQNPWQTASVPFNAYGPLFAVMAVTRPISPIANKLIFAAAYALFVIWLAKGPGRRSGAPAWVWLGLMILNPFPWQQIAWFGYFDILVALACVAAVHSLSQKRDGLSGGFLALGILLKFMPILALPFLAVRGRRWNGRLIGVCVGLVAAGFAASDLVWGASVFRPLAFAATRAPESSIYFIVNSAHTLVRLPFGHVDLGGLEKPLILAGVLGVFGLYLFRRIALLPAITLAMIVVVLFYRDGFINYQMTAFCLVAYLMASEWKDDASHRSMAVFLIAYFAFMTLADLDYWYPGWFPWLHPNVMVLVAFLMGCALLIALLRFSLARPGTGDPIPG